MQLAAPTKLLSSLTMSCVLDTATTVPAVSVATTHTERLAVLPRGSPAPEGAAGVAALSAWRAIRRASRRAGVGELAPDAARARNRLAAARLAAATQALRRGLPAGGAPLDVSWDAVLGAAVAVGAGGRWSGGVAAAAALCRAVYTLVVCDSLLVWAPFSGMKQFVRLGGAVVAHLLPPAPAAPPAPGGGDGLPSHAHSRSSSAGAAMPGGAAVEQRGAGRVMDDASLGALAGILGDSTPTAADAAGATPTSSTEREWLSRRLLQGVPQTVARSLLAALLAAGMPAAAYVPPGAVDAYDDAVARHARFTLASLLPNFMRAAAPTEPVPGATPPLVLLCNPAAGALPLEHALTAASIVAAGIPRAALEAAQATLTARAPPAAAAGSSSSGSGVSTAAAVARLRGRLVVVRGASIMAAVACPPPPVSAATASLILPVAAPGNAKRVRELGGVERQRRRAAYTAAAVALDGGARGGARRPSAPRGGARRGGGWGGGGGGARGGTAGAGGAGGGRRGGGEGRRPPPPLLMATVGAGGGGGSGEAVSSEAGAGQAAAVAVVVRELAALAVGCAVASTGTALVPPAAVALLAASRVPLPVLEYVRVTLPAVLPASSTATTGKAASGRAGRTSSATGGGGSGSSTAIAAVPAAAPDSGAVRVVTAVAYRGGTGELYAAALRVCMLSYGASLLRAASRQGAVSVPEAWSSRYLLHGSQPLFHFGGVAGGGTISRPRSPLPGAAFHEVEPLAGRPQAALAWLCGTAAGVGELATGDVHAEAWARATGVAASGTLAASPAAPSPGFSAAFPTVALPAAALAYPCPPQPGGGAGDVIGLGAFAPAVTGVWHVVLLQAADLLEGGEVVTRLRFLLPHVTLLFVPGPPPAVKAAAKYLTAALTAAADTVRRNTAPLTSPVSSGGSGGGSGGGGGGSGSSSVAATATLSAAAEPAYEEWLGATLRHALLPGRDAATGALSILPAIASVVVPAATPFAQLATALAGLRADTGISVAVANPPPC